MLKSQYVKNVQMRSSFWSEYKKIRTTNNYVFGDFLRSVCLILEAKLGDDPRLRKFGTE